MNFDLATLFNESSLVDNAAGNLRAVSMTLTQRGAWVRCATNGETASVTSNNCLSDLVLLAIRLLIMEEVLLPVVSVTVMMPLGQRPIHDRSIQL